MAWRLNPRALARASSRHPWRTLTVWVVLLIVGGGLSSVLLAGALTTDIDFTNEPESKRAAELIEGRLPGQELHTELVVVTSAMLTVRDGSYRSYVDDLQTAIADLGVQAVRSVGSYLTKSGPVSEDGRTTLLPVVLSSSDTDDAADEAAELMAIVADTRAPTGIRTLVAGPATLSNDSNEIVEEDLAKGETIGILAALIILVLVFGAVVAGLVPIAVAMVSITVSFGASALVGLAFD